MLFFPAFPSHESMLYGSNNLIFFSMTENWHYQWMKNEDETITLQAAVPTRMIEEWENNFSNT